MSNIFKSHSRFDALVDDTPSSKNDKNQHQDQLKDQDRLKDQDQLKDQEKEREQNLNSFKKRDDRQSDISCFRPFDENEKERRRLKRESEIKAQKEFEEQERDKIKKQSLTINKNNFPELLVHLKENNNSNQSESYIEKLTKPDVVIDSNTDLEPGWISLKKNSSINPKKDVVKQETSQKECFTDIFNSLIELHEKRRQEYIDNYGYEKWERMFKFPNWREEESYLEMMEQESDDHESSEEE
jgi:hypothetical protein